MLSVLLGHLPALQGSFMPRQPRADASSVLRPPPCFWLAVPEMQRPDRGGQGEDAHMVICTFVHFQRIREKLKPCLGLGFGITNVQKAISFITATLPLTKEIKWSPGDKMLNRTQKQDLTSLYLLGSETIHIHILLNTVHLAQ